MLQLWIFTLKLLKKMKNKTKFPIKGSKYMNEEIIRKVCSEIIEQTREKYISHKRNYSIFYIIKWRYIRGAADYKKYKVIYHEYIDYSVKEKEIKISSGDSELLIFL